MSDIRRRMIRLMVAATVAGLLCACGAALAQPYDPGSYAGLRWRMIGPFRGGGGKAGAGVPGQPATFFFGSVRGGGWETAHAGPPPETAFGSPPTPSLRALRGAPPTPKPGF